ncbi:hypothetical protein [Roseateles sp.]|uniref:hypothetical protein n=1 Tax=Roseateles sp. TaxID=1971397 RepID=UPI003BA6286A
MLIPEHWRWFDHKSPDYDRAWQQRVDMLKRIRSGEIDLVALKEHYRANPVDFICDWIITREPRNIERNLPTAIPLILFERQAEFVQWLMDRWKGREHGVCAKSRDMGVSVTTCAAFVSFWLFNEGFVGSIGSRRETMVDNGSDPNSIFWKLRDMVHTLPVEFIPAGYKPAEHATRMKLANPATGATLVGEAGRNIGRGGRSSIAFVDESAFVENAQDVEAALSQNSNCIIHSSTPNGMGNVFAKKWHSGRVSKFKFHWTQDKRKDQDWYERMCATLDPVVVAAEIDISFTASVANAFISGEDVSMAQRLGPADVEAIGPIMIGVDVARFGNDKSCITVRRGRVCSRIEVFGKADVVDVAGRVIDVCRSMHEPPSQIAVDTIGIGAGVADTLRRNERFGHLVVDVNSSLRLDDGECYNLRARMWRDMRDWLQGRVSIPNDPQLASELTALQYGYKGQLLLIESKDDAKKRGISSPDMADSLALTFAYPPEKRKQQRPMAPAWAPADDISGY